VQGPTEPDSAQPNQIRELRPAADPDSTSKSGSA
jgi:hypothetical protein